MWQYYTHNNKPWFHTSTSGYGTGAAMNPDVHLVCKIPNVINPTTMCASTCYPHLYHELLSSGQRAFRPSPTTGGVVSNGRATLLSQTAGNFQEISRFESDATTTNTAGNVQAYSLKYLSATGGSGTYTRWAGPHTAAQNADVRVYSSHNTYRNWFLIQDPDLAGASGKDGIFAVNQLLKQCWRPDYGITTYSALDANGALKVATDLRDCDFAGNSHRMSLQCECPSPSAPPPAARAQ